MSSGCEKAVGICPIVFFDFFIKEMFEKRLKSLQKREK
ncbi:hypothetical protein STRDD11_01838 [Streptococcus sp. DD11]|nr:hypothetical protein STRDD11_01838 [Streptococcus sp. DD11]